MLVTAAQAVVRAAAVRVKVVAAARAVVATKAAAVRTICPRRGRWGAGVRGAVGGVGRGGRLRGGECGGRDNARSGTTARAAFGAGCRGSLAPRPEGSAGRRPPRNRHGEGVPTKGSIFVKQIALISDAFRYAR